MHPATIIDPTRELHALKPLVKFLLLCGVLSSVFYIALNIVVSMQYEGCNVASQAVSELSAIEAPTRPLWTTLIIIYSFFVLAFGWEVWVSAGRNRPLRIAGILIIVGLLWPPMHQREALAAGAGSQTDQLHIVFTIITIVLMLLVIGFGAAALGRSFLWFSILTIAILIGFGTLTGLYAPRMEANLPTPWMGVWERISIGAYMAWIMVFQLLFCVRKRTSNPYKIENLILNNHGLPYTLILKTRA